jgi:predicted kinase
VQSDAPLLVLVSGAPAGGKTTLARRLSVDLRLPLIVRDELKEVLADAMGHPADTPAANRLGAAAYGVLVSIARGMLMSGHGVILESNFRRGVSEVDLRPLLAHSDACLIHCTAAREVLRARYAARAARGERHPAHLDGARLEALDHDLEAGRFDPLELSVPTLVVDTNDGLRPTYEEIRDFAAFPRAAALA